MSKISRRARFWARLCRIILTILGITVFISCAMAMELSIEITEGAVIKRPVTHVSNLARIACKNMDMLKKTASAAIKVERGYVTPQDIVLALSNAGIGGVTLRLSMADRVPVRLESRLESWVAKTAGWPGITVIDERYSIPPGYSIDSSLKLYPGTEVLNLRLRGKSGNITEPLHIRWLIVAVVADRPLARGQRIKSEDLAIKNIEYERNRSYFSDPSDLVGKIVNRDMSKNEPFIERQTEEPDVVKSGDRVRIVCIKGSLNVWASGRAMESGVIGDTIKVRNLRTRKTIFGIITASGTVEVNDR